MDETLYDINEHIKMEFKTWIMYELYDLIKDKLDGSLTQELDGQATIVEMAGHWRCSGRSSP